MRIVVAIVAVGLGLACGSAGAFVCQSDAQCTEAATGGACEADGNCSFPDAACPSGRRYGAYAAPGLAEQCVVPAQDDSSGASATGHGSAQGATASTTGGTSGDTSGDGNDTFALTSGATETAGQDTGASETMGETTDPDLVLWLTFDAMQGLWSDASDYQRVVTCDAGSCPEPALRGPSATAGVFDGVDDILVVPHDPDLETDNGLTVAVLVRNDLLSSLEIHTVIARPYGVLSENSWELFFRDDDFDGENDVVFEIAQADEGQQQLIVSPLASKGQWQRIVAVWTDDSIAVFIDGALSASVPVAGMILDANPIYVGGDSDNAVLSHYFNGALDDVRVYRRALSPDEIAALP